MGESYRSFFESVQTAFSEDVNPWHIVIFLLLFIGTFSFGFLASWAYTQRNKIRRVLTYFSRLVSGQTTKDSRRFDVRRPLAIILPFSNQPTARTATVNLSVGGMFVKTSEPFPQQTSFEFILELPDGEQIQGTALVRWRQPHLTPGHPRGMGVEFINMNTPDKNRIRKYLKSSK